MFSRSVSLGGAAIVLALASALPAQRTQVVVPSEFNGFDLGLKTTLHFGGYGTGRVQQVVRASVIHNVTCTIQELGLAPSNLNLSALIGTPPAISRLDVTLGYSATGPDKLSTSFAQNRKGTQTLLYSGSFQRPVDIFNVPFASTIKLTRPFVYDPAKGDLLLEYVVPVPSAPTLLWYLNLSDDSAGTGKVRVLSGRGPFSAPEWFLTEWSNDLLLRRGGTLNMTVSGFSRAYGSVIAFGTSSRTWGPLRLPHAIGGTGMLAVSPELLVPAQWQVRGGPRWEMSAGLPIPDSLAFEGRKLYAQGICVDAKANPLGFVFTNGIEMEIARTTWRQSMVAATSHSSATGTLMGGQGYVVTALGDLPLSAKLGAERRLRSREIAVGEAVPTWSDGSPRPSGGCRRAA